MKRNEFWLGVFVYGLIISAGLFRTNLEKLVNIPWDRPIYSLDQDHFQSSLGISNPQIKRALLASKAKRILTADRGALLVKAQDSIRQKLDQKWKRIASQPDVFKTGTESSGDSPPLLGIKTGSKTKTAMQEKNASVAEEPAKS